MRTNRALFYDVLLAASLAVVSVALFLSSDPAPFMTDLGPPPGTLRAPDAGGAALVALCWVPVAFRRRRPLAMLCAAQVPDVLMSGLGYGANLSGLAGLILLYSVAAHRGLAVALGAFAVVAAGYAVGTALAPLSPSWEDHFVVLVVAFTVWGTGRTLRLRRAYLEELKDRASRLERAREADTRAARAEERSRIARELHDVVAHHVSVMTVQAAAARKVLDSDPAVASEALTAIETTGRLAMNEMRNIVGVLRTDAPSRPAELGPQPGLGDLPALVEQMREAGLAVQLWIEGERGQLAPGLDLAAYRLVQEGLTNTLRHAGPGARAWVRVHHEVRELRVQVEDDGRGPGPASERTGHGLVGIRERVSLYGGILSIGPRTGGGFEVRATFPLRTLRGGAADKEAAIRMDGR
ncbi:sensor histidine kinase [Nonomuraea sp. NPDC046570]|uniref:sensor histidine kinase n=1 Tax=Nonomuraea sp. NPDC046570 TaxID=3155255 RepID=UPI0033E24E33